MKGNSRLVVGIVGTLLTLVVSSNGLNFCDNKWTKILETSASGVELFGNKADLVDAIMHGAEIRFYVNSWGGNGYASSTHNAYIKNGEVCFQALMHLSKSGWDSFQSNVYWWFLNICTTGHVHMSRWYVGSHTKVSDTKTSVQVTWFVRSIDSCRNNNIEPVLCNAANGTISSGNILTLAQAVEKGADIRVVSSTDPQNGYLTPFSNVATNSAGSLVGGQYIWHLSQSSNGNHIEFQDNAYWWFTMWSSDGTRDMSRWNVGAHTNRGHTNDRVPMKWFADSCWSLAYKHDKDGNVVQGSLDYLITVVRNGHRVKLVMGKYSIEADNLQIKNGHLSAQLLGHVSKASIKKFQDNAYWYWQHISTTGAFNTVRYNVGDTTNRGNSKGKIDASWYIDTRAWTHVLSTSSSGEVTFGSKSSLVNAVKAGSTLRFVVQLSCETIILNADNIGISNDGNDVAAQVIRTVSYTDDNVRKFQSNPYWWFIIASTKGQLKISKWTVGKHKNRGSETKTAEIHWFIY